MFPCGSCEMGTGTMNIYQRTALVNCYVFWKHTLDWIPFIKEGGQFSPTSPSSSNPKYLPIPLVGEGVSPKITWGGNWRSPKQRDWHFQCGNLGRIQVNAKSVVNLQSGQELVCVIKSNQFIVTSAWIFHDMRSRRGLLLLFSAKLSLMVSHANTEFA